MRRFIPFTILALALLVPRAATAHIEITSHVTRHGVDQQKVAPCGAAGDTGPGDMVYTYAPGETITITWTEFVNHPGHYRVAFDADGSDDFVDPASADDLYTNAAVLLDGIPDEAGVSDYSVEVTLPSDECESCTIQVLQIMTDKPPFGDGNDMYYHCIDVRLVAEAGDGDGDSGDGDPGDGDGDPGDGDSGDGDGDPGDGDPGDGDGETGTPVDEAESGCGCSTAPDKLPLGLASLALLTLIGARRRSRRRAT